MSGATENKTSGWTCFLGMMVFMTPKKPGSDLYVIQMAVTGDFKVGRTNNINRRLGELQTGCPQKLRVILHAPGRGGEEKKVHRDLLQYQTRVLKGEWFKVEGMGHIPDHLWEMITPEVLEDPDWWKQG